MRLFLVCLNIYSTTWESDRKEKKCLICVLVSVLRSSGLCRSRSWCSGADFYSRPLHIYQTEAEETLLWFDIVCTSTWFSDLYLTYCQCTIRQSELFLHAVYQKTQMQCETLWDVWNKSKWMGRNSLFTCSNSTPVTHHWSKLSHLFQSL